MTTLQISIILILLVIVTLGFVVFFKNYIKVPQDKILVIFGIASSKNDLGFLMVEKGRKFVWPFIQMAEFLDLNEYNLSYREICVNSG